MGRLGRKMGAISSNYWRVSFENYPECFTLKDALAWVHKDMWSVFEATQLLSGIKPRNQNWYGFEIEAINKLLESRVIDESPTLNLNKIYSLSGYKTKDRDLSVPFSAKSNLIFPVAAYFDFAMAELFPSDKGNFDLPCFGIFHDLQKESEGHDVIEPIEPQFAMALTRLGCKHPLLVAEPMPQKDVPPWEQLPMSQDQTEQLGEAPDDQAIIEGLTVADVRAMCAHSTPLKSILIATANWHKIPNGYQQKRDDTALETLLSKQAKIDRWGTANDNGVAKEDLPILKRYITGNVKGRGKK